MGWAEITSFNPSIKNWPYVKVIRIFGEEKGLLVAEHFGIKKVSKKDKKTKKKD